MHVGEETDIPNSLFDSDRRSAAAQKTPMRDMLSGNVNVYDVSKRWAE